MRSARPRSKSSSGRRSTSVAQAFEACYAAFAREIADPVPRNKWLAVLPALIARQIVHLGRDAKLRLYRCERWSPAKWTELFTPFSRACSLRFEREPVRLDDMGAPTTIERQFLMILVLKLADPGNLAAKELEWIAAQLDEWCQPLRLTLKPTSATRRSTSISPAARGSSAGRWRRSKAACCSATCSPFTRCCSRTGWCWRRPCAASRARARSRNTASSSSFSSRLRAGSIPSTSRSPGAASASPRAAPSTPSSASPTSAAFVRSDMAKPSIDTSVGRNFGSTMDLAVFGRSRAESELAARARAGRISTFATSGGPWEIKDISASGFRLYRADEHRGGAHAQHARRDTPPRRGSLGDGHHPAHAQAVDARTRRSGCSSSRIRSRAPSSIEQKKARDDQLFGQRRESRRRGATVPRPAFFRSGGGRTRPRSSR